MHDIYSRTPVNKTAALSVSQKNCSEYDEPIRPDEIANRIGILQKNHKNLKDSLGIKNKTQHTNLMYRFNKKTRKTGTHKQPELLTEYVRIGQEIQRLQRHLQDQNKAVV